MRETDEFNANDRVGMSLYTCCMKKESQQCAGFLKYFKRNVAHFTVLRFATADYCRHSTAIE
jgi:hypothetical protein